MNDFELSDQDHLLAGPGSKTKLDPETARIRDAIIESFRDRPISEINGMAKKVLSIETDPVKRLGMLAARVYLLRHRIMNLKMGAEDIDRLGSANKQSQQAEGVTDAADENDNVQTGETDWIRVRMLEEAEMNGMRFFEGIVVDVRKEDATKLVESGRAQIVAEQPEEAAPAEAEAEAEAEVKVEVEADTATGEVEADTATAEVEADAATGEVEADAATVEVEVEVEADAATAEVEADAASVEVEVEADAAENAAENAAEDTAEDNPEDSLEETPEAGGADDGTEVDETGDDEESTDKS